MAYERNSAVVRGPATARAAIDEGLRAHMLKVYNYMGLGLALTGIVALAVATSPAMMQFLHMSGLAIVVHLSPLAFILVLSFGINRLSPGAAQMLFWAFAAVMGLSISSIFLVYSGASIARVFFIAAAMFGAMSLYGYTTKRSLASWGSFLFMGVIGLIIASVVNWFMASSMLHFAISIIGVFVFLGLTAYDTQRVKEEYVAGDGTIVAEKKAIYGALSLYLDFILLFQFLLSLLGGRE